MPQMNYFLIKIEIWVLGKSTQNTSFAQSLCLIGQVVPEEKINTENWFMDGHICIGKKNGS